jgi:hypothetical protein
LEEIIAIASLAGVLYLIIRPLFKRKIKRNKRKRILLYVDKIAKSYRGKTKMRVDPKRDCIEVPNSDVADFKNLGDLSYGAEGLLTEEENHSIQELIKTYEDEKFNDYRSTSSISIRPKSAEEIADLAEKLQGILKKHI